jgi:hypothetical protein
MYTYGAMACTMGIHRVGQTKAEHMVARVLTVCRVVVGLRLWRQRWGISIGKPPKATHCGIAARRLLPKKNVTQSV